MQHAVDDINVQEDVTQLLERREEHPALHVDLRHLATKDQSFHAHVHEHRE